MSQQITEPSFRRLESQGSVGPWGSPGVAGSELRRGPSVAQEHDTRVAVLSARWGLTPCQRAVLALLVDGDANKEIAVKLRCSVKAVEGHVTLLLRAAGVDGRTRLVARFWTAR